MSSFQVSPELLGLIDQAALVTGGARKYPNVCGDLSLRLSEVTDGHISPEDMVAHLRRIGTDRILYGSNFPLNEVLHADKPPSGREYQLTQTLKGLEALATLPLTEDERADIAGRNFRRWMRLNRPNQPSAPATSVPPGPTQS